MRKHLCLWPRIALFYAVGQIFPLSVLVLSPDIGLCDSLPFLVTRFNTSFFLYYIEDKNHWPLACLNLMLLELEEKTAQRAHYLMWYFTVVLPTRIESHLRFSLWAQLRNQLGKKKKCKCHIKFKILSWLLLKMNQITLLIPRFKINFSLLAMSIVLIQRNIQLTLKCFLAFPFVFKFSLGSWLRRVFCQGEFWCINGTINLNIIFYYYCLHINKVINNYFLSF